MFLIWLVQQAGSWQDHHRTHSHRHTHSHRASEVWCKMMAQKNHGTLCIQDQAASERRQNCLLPPNRTEPRCVCVGVFVFPAPFCPSPPSENLLAHGWVSYKVELKSQPALLRNAVARSLLQKRTVPGYLLLEPARPVRRPNWVLRVGFFCGLFPICSGPTGRAVTLTQEPAGFLRRQP